MKPNVARIDHMNQTFPGRRDAIVTEGIPSKYVRVENTLSLHKTFGEYDVID